MTIRVKLLEGVVAVVLAAVSGAAGAVNEVEPNNLPGAPQPLSAAPDLSVMRDGATISGALTPSFPPDLDFYSFYAMDNQVLTLHLRSTADGFVPVLTVISPSKRVHAVKVPDSADLREVVLAELALNETGVWSVAVTPFEVLIGNPSATEFQFLILEGSFPYQPFIGPYTLDLIPAAPAASVQPIGIEIKPGSGEWAPINPKAKGVIPVALLAAPGFDPFNIDVSSLRFGATGDEATLRRCAAGGQDVEGDGDLDRVCTFESQGTHFNAGSTMGILKGRTATGSEFQGQGFLKVVPKLKSALGKR